MQWEEQGGFGAAECISRERSARPVGNGLALPSWPGGRPLRRRPDDDGHRAKRDYTHRVGPSRGRPSDRLLLRLPDDQRAANGQRGSRNRVPRARGRGSAGRAVLAGLPRLAPAYRQITLRALEHPNRITHADAVIAYDSVLSAFRDYMAHFNHGRGIVFVGHSQGAAILIQLLKREVDGKPGVRRRLISAILLGGNVTVPEGRSVGGDFGHIPACRSSRQTGCVVAYSSFTSRPPQNSQFGRTTSDSGVRLLAPHNPSPALRIMCVNPASPAGGTALLDPYLPSLVLAFLPAGSAPKVHTPWVSAPGEYRARCESSGNATWLQVTRVAGNTDRRPLLAHLRDPALGLHILDVNIALGNLVRLVRDEAASYRRTS